MESVKKVKKRINKKVNFIILKAEESRKKELYKSIHYEEECLKRRKINKKGKL